MNAKDIVYGYAIGYNDGLKNGGGGEPEPYLSDMGTLKAVIDDGKANLSIVLTDNGNNDTGKQIFSVYGYTYALKTITANITTSATSADGTTTTTTKSFSKSIIDKLYNKSGKAILSAVYKNESKGEVSHYLDENKKKIYLNGDYANE